MARPARWEPERLRHQADRPHGRVLRAAAGGGAAQGGRDARAARLKARTESPEEWHAQPAVEMALLAVAPRIVVLRVGKRTAVVGGKDDAGEGRIIPTNSMDQYAATLASWYGLPAGNFADVFPNLARFNDLDLGFLKGG